VIKEKNKDNKKGKFMSLEVLILESVGACVNTEGMTYPLNIDGTPDTDNGVHFSECESEWFDKLSDDDYSLFLEWHTKHSLSAFKEGGKFHGYTPEQLNDLDSNYVEEAEFISRWENGEELF
tara:strand:+ start:82 stop:447 length:366 start_codon:yes stop_codon:yes gene_type:complete